MKKRLIEIEETDLYFNKCTCCGKSKDTKKVIIGNCFEGKSLRPSFILCKACRIELYNKLKENYDK